MAGDLIVSALTTGTSTGVPWGQSGTQIVTIGGVPDGATVSFIAYEPSLSNESITSSEIILFDCTVATTKQVKLSSSHWVKISIASAGASTSIYATKREVQKD